MKKKSSSSASQSQMKNGEEKYEVEYIFDKRIKKGVTQFLVKWIGYPILQSTWEPPTHFKGCEHFIEEFEKSGASKTCIGEVSSDFEDDETLLIDAFTPSVVSMDLMMSEKAETKVLKKRASNSSIKSDSDEVPPEKKEKKGDEKIQDKEKIVKQKVSKDIKKSIKKKKPLIVSETNSTLKSSPAPTPKLKSKPKPKSKLNSKPEPERKKENKIQVVIEEKKAEVLKPVVDVSRPAKIHKTRKTFSENNNTQKVVAEKPKQKPVSEEKKKSKSEVKRPAPVAPVPVVIPASTERITRMRISVDGVSKLESSKNNNDKSTKKEKILTRSSRKLRGVKGF